jgi:PQQ-dependent dehydrogenase (methanol/ethanol family)
MKQISVVLLVLGLMVGCAGTMTPNVTGARILAADTEPQNWLTHGRTYGEQRFSPLAKITTANVNQLGLAWSHDIKARTARGVEATPIVVDGVIYATGGWSHVFALEAKTGTLLWEFDPQVPGAYGAKGCCDIVNRGVAVWAGKVYVGAFDGRLIALDAKTGAKVWETLTVDQTKDYTITGAPRVVKGKVLIGNGGADFGVRGYVSAYDAETGKMLWRFYTVPGNPADGFETKTVETIAKTWSGEWWKHGGGGTVWDSMAYDQDLDLLYIGVGNGAPWNYKMRSDGTGDNLFLASIVALRPDTGEYVWHFQTTPAEDWDYTATQHMILADLTIDGRVRKVLMQAPKNGFFYVLDRATGEFISGSAYVNVTWASGLDAKTGRPVEKPEARYSTTGKPLLMQPGPIGGHNWQPMSYSPATGLVYVPATDGAFFYMAADPKTFQRRPGVFWNTGINPASSSLPDDEAVRKAIRASAKGRLIAWDPVRQKAAWEVVFPIGWNGGTLATAGGLVFQGNGIGKFAAYDAANGKALWDFFAQTGIVAAPVTYEVDGEQYVTVLAGWGGALPLFAGEVVTQAPRGGVNRVLTFKLGARAALPALTTVRKPFDPPALTATPQTVNQGRTLYEVYCTQCHGHSVVAGGVVPDLRYSASLASRDTYASVVLGGLLIKNGMLPFAQYLKPDDVEAIRAYVIREAQREKQRLANP